jgi:hypothetical protein
LTALRSPNGPQPADILGGENKPPLDAHEKLPQRGEGTPAPDIQLLGATTFGNLLASDEVVEAFALQIGECTGLLRANAGTTTLAGEKRRRWTRRAGTSGGSCGRKASPRRRLNDCYRLAESRRESCGPRSFSIGRAGGTASPGCSLSPLPSFSLILLANIDGAVRTTFVRVCSLDIISTDE